MYARMGNPARHGRLARAHRVSGLRGLRGDGIVARRLAALGYGDAGGVDWSGITQNLITTAGNVAKVAVSPGPVPTYQAITTPGGYSSVTSYGPLGTSPLSTTASLDSFDALLTSPLVLLGGLALFAVVLMKR